MKKITQLTLFLFLFQFSTFAQYTLTSDDAEVNADGYITNFSAAEKDIIIPEQLDGYTVKGIIDEFPSSNGVFAENNLTSVKLPATIEYIGEFAFHDNDIVSIDFSDCIALQTIGWSAFYDNIIDSLDLSPCIALKTIGKTSFSTNQITTLTFPSSITLMGYGCFMTNKINKVNGVASKGLIFKRNEDASTDSTVIVSYGGNSTIVDFISEDVTEFTQSAFYGSDLETIDLSNHKSLSSIGELCFQYSDITAIDLTECNSLTFIGDDAFNQTDITSFDLPTPSILGYEFSEWLDESGITIPLTDGKYTVTNIRSSYEAIMIPLGHELTFVVTNGTDAVEGAIIILDGYGKQTTNNNGEASFPNALEGNIDYTVSATGFETLEASVNMGTAEKIEDVLITANSTSINQNISQSHCTTWPNPCAETVFIESNTVIKTVELFNLRGELIQQFTVGAMDAKIDLDYCNSGLVIVKTKYTNGTESIQKIVKE